MKSSFTLQLPGRLALKVWARDFMVWRRFLAPSLLGNLGEPLLFLAAVGLGLGRLVEQVQGVPYVQFVAPGLAMSSTMYAATLEACYNAFTRFEHQKTYHAIVSTPVSLEEVIAGEWLWAATKGFVAGASVLAVMLVFGLVPWGAVPGILLAAAAAALFFGAAGLVATSLAYSYDFFHYYLTGFISPMFLFGGVFFPVGALPDWLQPFSQVMPLNAAVTLSRGAVLGGLDPLGVVWRGLALALGGTALMLVAAWRVKVRLYR